MILSFDDEETADIYDNVKTKTALKRLPTALWSIAQRKLDMINSAVRFEDLRIPPGNRLEVLKGNFNGMISIRINDQYRIIFDWLGSDADQIKIIDYH